MNNPYRKDRSYIKQRLEYVSSVDYIIELENKIDNLQQEKEEYKSRNGKAIDKIAKLKPFIPNEIPSWLDELENILNNGDEE